MSHLHPRSTRRRLLSCLAVVAAVMATRAGAESVFFLETVDETGDVGKYSSLTFDQWGNPHISYLDETNGDLKYAVKLRGLWIIETVDSVGATGYKSSVAVDGEGNPHISYRDIDNFDLRHAFKRDGIWIKETVAMSGVDFTSLALDEEGIPHIAYSTDSLLYAVKTGGTWNYETVDTTAGVGAYASLVLDGRGNPHIAYRDGANNYLKYAVKVGSSWTTEPVDPSLGSGHYASMALTPEGTPFIVHTVPGAGMRYTVGVIGGWITYSILTGANTGLWADVALDSWGNPHISYFEGGAVRDLVYLMMKDGNWVQEVVDAPGGVGSLTSIALDPQGNPHISYYDETNKDLLFADAGVHLTSPVGGETWLSSDRTTVAWDGLGSVDIEVSPDGGATYATLLTGVSGGFAVVSVPDWNTLDARVRIVRADPFSTSESPGAFTVVPRKIGAWWHETADSTGKAGAYTSLALDARGRPHVSYREVTDSDIWYAVRTGGVWSSEIVDTAGTLVYTSLALDSQGTPHICYVNLDSGDLQYAVQAGGVWNTETVDAGVNAHFPSLALDSQNVPHVSYYDSSPNDDLKYAVRAGGIWSIETVDATGSVGYTSSIALDIHNNPHISYHDLTNAELKYAVKTSGSWTIETADAEGFVGRNSSLVLDAESDPHISYYDHVDDDLKYATKSGGNWFTDLVDTPGNVGEYSSLKLDSHGTPHIAYYYTTDGNLKYAVRVGDGWYLEVVDASGEQVGVNASLSLDDENNAHIAYRDFTDGDFEYASGAVELAVPIGGEVWPIGAVRSIRWDGVGVVDISLSVDGGATYPIVLATSVSGGTYDLRVPHTPSRFCRVRVERRSENNALPGGFYRRSIAESDSLFTIEASIELFSLSAKPLAEGGVLLTWQTDPGPQDLAGYRIERSPVNHDEWQVVAPLVRETSYHDASGGPGLRYRLVAIDGLGGELLLGEISLTPRAALSAWPLPYRGGELTVSFLTAGGLGGVAARAEVAVFDLQGRRVRTLLRGEYEAGLQTASWDGLDETGRTVSSGVYFLRAATGGQSTQIKLVVVQ